jgi:cysteine desulfurase / selenocysteine lyase
MISFEMRAIMSSTPVAVALVIDQDGVAVRAGTQCTMPLHQRFGTTATGWARLRSTMTRDDADRLSTALRKAHERLT